MTRYLDHKYRQDEILKYLIKLYIQEGKPVSSSYLKDRYHLPFSSATLRNIMEELEELGFLVHIHTSSGRIPTQRGFRYYVNFLIDLEEVKEARDNLLQTIDESLRYIEELDRLLDEASRIISELTHYAGFSLSEDHKDRLYFSGARFIVEQPDFEDINTLRKIFATFEEKSFLFWKFLEEKLSEEDTSVFIGNEISLEDINSCSLVISSLRLKKNKKAVLGVLGPMRMNYACTIVRLKTLRNYLIQLLGDSDGERRSER